MYYLFLLIYALIILVCIGFAEHDLNKTAGEIWYNIDPDSLNLTQVIFQRYFLPSFWDPLFVAVLLLPVWKILFLLTFIIICASLGLVIWNKYRSKLNTD